MARTKKSARKRKLNFGIKAKDKVKELNPNRFVFWRRDPNELNRENGVYPVISTLERKMEEAHEIIEQGKYNTVMILEIVKLVKKAPAPAIEEDYKGKECDHIDWALGLADHRG